MCYGDQEAPRQPHDGIVPSTDFVRPCFQQPFTEGSSRTPRDLTPLARILHEVLRRTILPRIGARDTITRLQLWLLAHIVRKEQFDLWDLIVSELEDIIAAGFRGHWQLQFAHWISYLIVAKTGSGVMRVTLTRSATEFPVYSMSQLVPMGSCLDPAEPTDQA